MSIERYTPEACQNTGIMVEEEDGDYVTYADHLATIATLTAELEKHRKLVEAARDMLEQGEHDGPCDNVIRLSDGTTMRDGACTRHLAASERRTQRLIEALAQLKEQDDE